MKRVAAGAHLQTPWFFEPAKAQTTEPTTAWIEESERGDKNEHNSNVI